MTFSIEAIEEILHQYAQRHPPATMDCILLRELFKEIGSQKADFRAVKEGL